MKGEGTVLVFEVDYCQIILVRFLNCASSGIPTSHSSNAIWRRKEIPSCNFPIVEDMTKLTQTPRILTCLLQTSRCIIIGTRVDKLLQKYF